MTFKSTKQRKKVMMMLRKNGFTDNSAKFIVKKNPKVGEFKEVKDDVWCKSCGEFPKVGGKRLCMKCLFKTKDTDGDGVPDHKDCEPLNPKKQGVLHDFAIKRLKAKEEKLEKKRQVAMDNLNDKTELLKAKTAVAKKKSTIKQIELREKQSIIDEINKERKATEDLKQANREAQNQLDKLTITGKTKTLAKKSVVTVGKTSATALKATNAFLNKESTKKSIRNATRSAGNILNSVLGFSKKKKPFKTER